MAPTRSTSADGASANVQLSVDKDGVAISPDIECSPVMRATSLHRQCSSAQKLPAQLASEVKRVSAAAKKAKKLRKAVGMHNVGRGKSTHHRENCGGDDQILESRAERIAVSVSNAADGSDGEQDAIAQVVGLGAKGITGLVKPNGVEAPSDLVVSQAKKKRGRPSNADKEAMALATQAARNMANSTSHQSEPARRTPTRKKQGAMHSASKAPETDAPGEDTTPDEAVVPPKKKRGRPPKSTKRTAPEAKAVAPTTKTFVIATDKTSTAAETATVSRSAGSDGLVLHDSALSRSQNSSPVKKNCESLVPGKRRVGRPSKQTKISEAAAVAFDVSMQNTSSQRMAPATRASSALAEENVDTLGPRSRSGEDEKYHWYVVPSNIDGPALVNAMEPESRGNGLNVEQQPAPTGTAGHVRSAEESTGLLPVKRKRGRPSKAAKAAEAMVRASVSSAAVWAPESNVGIELSSTLLAGQESSLGEKAASKGKVALPSKPIASHPEAVHREASEKDQPIPSKGRVAKKSRKKKSRSSTGALGVGVVPPDALKKSQSVRRTQHATGVESGPRCAAQAGRASTSPLASDGVNENRGRGDPDVNICVKPRSERRSLRIEFERAAFEADTLVPTPDSPRGDVSFGDAGVANPESGRNPSPLSPRVALPTSGDTRDDRSNQRALSNSLHFGAVFGLVNGLSHGDADCTRFDGKGVDGDGNVDNRNTVLAHVERSADPPKKVAAAAAAAAERAALITREADVIDRATARTGTENDALLFAIGSHPSHMQNGLHSLALPSLGIAVEMLQKTTGAETKEAYCRFTETRFRAMESLSDARRTARESFEASTRNAYDAYESLCREAERTLIADLETAFEETRLTAAHRLGGRAREPNLAAETGGSPCPCVEDQVVGNTGSSGTHADASQVPVVRPTLPQRDGAPSRPSALSSDAYVASIDKANSSPPDARSGGAPSGQKQAGRKLQTDTLGHDVVSVFERNASRSGPNPVITLDDLVQILGKGKVAIRNRVALLCRSGVLGQNSGIVGKATDMNRAGYVLL